MNTQTTNTSRNDSPSLLRLFVEGSLPTRPLLLGTAQIMLALLCSLLLAQGVLG